MKDHGKSFVRGGQPYIRPTGCYRYALNIRGKYDGSDWWLGGGKNGGGWLMAYHGTSIENIREIVRTGFHMSKAKRTAFGRGVYCAPDPATAKQYATQFVEKGRRYRAILSAGWIRASTAWPKSQIGAMESTGLHSILAPSGLSPFVCTQNRAHVTEEGFRKSSENVLYPFDEPH